MIRAFVSFIVFFSIIAAAALNVIDSSAAAKQPLANKQLAKLFEASDALLVVNQEAQTELAVNPDELMIPASTVKLVTSLITLEQWGANYQWQTETAVAEQTLWVFGRGDPFLVSEEVVLLVKFLSHQISEPINKVIIDGSYFNYEVAPGRTLVDDPYNAPLSAVAANFNTVNLRRTASGFTSAEPQTPLTATARQVGELVLARKSWPLGTVERVNLQSASNAEKYFGELLIALMRNQNPELVSPSVDIVTVDSTAKQPNPAQMTPPDSAEYVTYKNSKTWPQMLQGALEFSNNFITDHAFLSLSHDTPKSFSGAQRQTREWLKEELSWAEFSLVDGSGLSRDNRLSVRQLNDVLTRLQPFKSLLSEYSFSAHNATVFAKTGTLNNVRSMAGYIEFPQHQYQFAFIFNRATPWQHREQTLKTLVEALAERQ